MTILICLYGPTGSGKSTVARYLVDMFEAELIKVAAPLYELQDAFYRTLGMEIDGQDGELLQFLANKIEKERPAWLGTRFLERVRQSPRDIVINDDCRLNSYPALRGAGFTFIRVRTSPDVLAARPRSDHTPVDHRHPVEQGFEQFDADYELVNDGALHDTLAAAASLVGRLVDRARDGAAGSRPDHRLLIESPRRDR